MAAYPLAGRAARWARRTLLVVLVVALALSDVVLLAPPQGAHASRFEQTGGTAYQVTLKVGSGLVYGLTQGASVTLPISVSVTAAVGLASASVLVQYDPLQLRPTACDPREGPSGGFCNISYDTENGLIRFNVLSDTGLLGNDIGIFDLAFAAASTSTARTQVPVTPLIESITDLHGNYMTSWAQGSTVNIAAPSGGAAVYVGTPNAPNPLSITRGQTITVPMIVTGLTGLGAASFSLAFDPAVVRPLECRSVQHPDASGMCALHDDHVAANLISQDGMPGSATESVTAFEVDFTTAPNALVDAKSQLNLTLGVFADIAGAAIPVRLINNTLKVSRAAGEVVPILRLEPVAQFLNGDARVTVQVFLDNGAALAAGSWGIRYDPLVVQAESCQTGPNVISAVCNPAAEPGLVRMTVLGLTEDGLPADLPANIGSIIFRRHPEAKAKQKSSLTFEVTNFADDLDQHLPFQTEAAEITLAQELGSPAAVAIHLIGTPPYPLHRGSSLDFPVNFTIDPLRPIANLTGSIHYDPTVLRPTRCVLNSPTADGPTAFCNAQYDTAQGIIRFTLFDAEGLSGSVTPFVLTFEAASTSVAEDTSLLHFTVEAIGGRLGEPRTWAATDEKVTIKGPVTAPRVLVGSPDLLNTETYTVTLGSTATAPLWVENVSNLGAGTIEVRYDPTIARATRCTLRSDLTPALDGGFCSLLPGVVRFAFVASQGITGSSQLYDIEFAQAPNAEGGERTPLDVVVLNFVDIDQYPIPTTIRGGILVIGAIGVTKTADPTHVPETGGSVTFTYEIKNNSAEAAKITILRDDKFGPLTGDTDCKVGTVLGGGASCAFEATFPVPAGNYGGSHTNIFTATVADGDGNKDTATDSETVIYTDVKPTITVAKTAKPTSLPEPGGNIEFTVVVTNNSFEPVTLTSLTDNVYGGLTGKGTCATGGTIAAGASYTCHFTGAVAGEPGAYTDTVTAVATDNDGSTDTKTATATVTLTDVKPTITVTKTANPTSLPEPGGNVEFTVVVTNNSFEPVTLTSLTDNVYGGLNGKSPCATGGAIAAGASYTCHFTGVVTGEPGAYTDTVAAVATDNDCSTATKTATATVTLTDVKPTITVTKTGSPTAVPETGGSVTFTYVVKNNSVEAAKITVLSDNKFGTLTNDTNCQVDTVLAGGASCSFAVLFPIPAGNYGGSHTNVFSATVTDGDGNYATATEPETITYTDVKPDITVLKTGVPSSVPKTGGNVTFTYRVTNRSTEAAKITVLTDNKFGTLAGNAACKVGTVLAAGATCQFSAIFAVPAGTYPGSHTNIFSATVTDGDGNYATATEPETITYTPPNTPGGKILPAATTCRQYRDASAGTMNRVQYTLRGTTISTVSPGVFFYYSTVQLTTGLFAITVPQSNAYTVTYSPTDVSPDVWPDIPAQNTDGIILWDAACNKVPATTASYDPVSNTATISGSAAADIYYLSVKYTPSTRYVLSTNSGLVGYGLPAVPTRPSVTYRFKTVLKEGDGTSTDVSGSAAAIVVIWKK
jgi:hypothetical protein